MFMWTISFKTNEHYKILCSITSSMPSSPFPAAIAPPSDTKRELHFSSASWVNSSLESVVLCREIEEEEKYI